MTPRLLALLLLAALPAAAQPADTTRADPAVIERADSLVAVQRDGRTVRRLVGDVYLTQQATHLFADEAVQTPAEDEILFLGNVIIAEEGDSLFADRVLYDEALKVGRATGDVRLYDGEVNVYASSARYFTREERATFEEGVRLVDSLTVLTSRRGTYFTEERRAEFADSVRLVDPASTLAADSLTYLRDEEIAVARGRVAIERLGDDEDAAEPDTTSRTLVFSDFAYTDEQADSSFVTGDPLLMQLRQDTTSQQRPLPYDTLLVRAERLYVLRDSVRRRLIASEDVRIWESAFAAVADSAVLDRFVFDPPRPTPRGPLESREELRLFGPGAARGQASGPLAWVEEAQITGDSLRLTSRNESADSLFAAPDAFAVQPDTLFPDRLHQLKGRTMTGRFLGDELRSLLVTPNAQAVYYLTGEDQQPGGAVRVTADTIRFTFRPGGDLETLRALSGLEGTRYPEEQLPSPLRLDGFVYAPTLRPTKSALLDPPDPSPTAPPPQLDPVAEALLLLEEVLVPL